MTQALHHEPVQNQAALKAAMEGVALYDRSDWGRIEITDNDRRSFLHNQSTNDIKQLQPGKGCETVILTSTARTIDLATVYCQSDSLLLLVSPNRREQLMQWFDRYIFFQDKVKLTDQTENTGTFSLIGPKSIELLTQWGWELPTEQHHHTTVSHDGHTITIARGSGLASEGYTLIFETAIAESLKAKLVNAKVVVMGEAMWETLRIAQGRPQPDAELTEAFNPLEAGLWHLISFDKGCYIGQETIARLDTYDGVKQKLWGLSFSAPIPAGTPIIVNAKKVGVVTSVNPEGIRGLGYVKTKAGGAGDQVQLGETMAANRPKTIATLIEVPFLTREKGPSNFESGNPH